VSDIPPTCVLPCGCLLRPSIDEDGLKVLTVIPCHQNCHVVAYIYEEAAAQDKLVVEREAP